MTTNPKVTRLIAERDTALETVERQKAAIAVQWSKIRKLEAKLAKRNNTTQKKVIKHGRRAR